MCVTSCMIALCLTAQIWDICNVYCRFFLMMSILQSEVFIAVSCVFAGCLMMRRRLKWVLWSVSNTNSCNLLVFSLNGKVRAHLFLLFLMSEVGNLLYKSVTLCVILSHSAAHLLKFRPEKQQEQKNMNTKIERRR